MASDITMIQLKNTVTETETMTVRKFTRRENITYIIEEILILMRSSIDEEEELEIFRKNLMTLKKIEYFNRELRKSLGRHDASVRSCDENTHIKVHSERSKPIGRAAKLLVCTDELIIRLNNNRF